MDVRPEGAAEAASPRGAARVDARAERGAARAGAATARLLDPLAELAARLLGGSQASIWSRPARGRSDVPRVRCSWGGPPSLSARALHDLAACTGERLTAPGTLSERSLRGGLPVDPGCCVAVPLRCHDGRVIGSVCVEGVPALGAPTADAWQLLECVARQAVAVLTLVEAGGDRPASAADDVPLPVPSVDGDPLTGLPGRRLLLRRLADAVVRAGQDGVADVAVVCVDLDDVTAVNSALGHAAGDELIDAVAARLRGTVHGEDLVAGLGGDVLAVMCRHVRGAGGVQQLASRVQAALGRDLLLGGQLVAVSASIGSALAHRQATAQQTHRADPGGAGEALLQAAYSSMHVAKQRRHRPSRSWGDWGGGNGPLLRMRVAAELRAALRADDQLSLAYQPAFGLRDGQLHGVEALLRWRHPQHGLQCTAEFIEVAEEREVIVPLGAWVLRTACAQAASWYHAAGERAPLLWVNVSSRQLGRDELAGVVDEALRSTGLPAHKLGLELTERQVVEVTGPVRAELTQLAEMGCRLALDDFGTGHNDICQLRALPLDTMKLDRSYVAGLGANETDTVIAANLVALGKALGLAVVAEGVETPAQRRMLEELGCDLVQGYLFHRPGLAAGIDRLLEASATG
nr:sensor domain-containing phosphodiesterase [Motilibacter deserti]